MNRGKKSVVPTVGGYTIVEVIIFLAVSGAMFFSALAFIGGQQNKAQFVSAVRDFESRLTDIANDVTTGYYTKSADFSCDEQSSRPNITDILTTDQGMNGECIFVGTVIKFGDQSGNRDTFKQFAMAGLRKNGSGQNVTTLAEAYPRPIYGSSSNLQNAVQTFKINYGAEVTCIALNANSCNPSLNGNAAIGFFTTFGGVSLGSGSSIQSDIITYSNVNFYDNIAAAVSGISTPTTPLSFSNVLICLESGGTKQYALIKIGGSNAGSSTVITEIKNYSGGSAPCN